VASERDFAEALSDALGPLYRVSILNGDGEVEATFGHIKTNRPAQTEILLPRSSRKLLLELDAEAVEAGIGALSSLFPRVDAGEAPSGVFTHVDQAINELLSMAEAQIRLPIAQMTRAQKQQVVRFLDERGAFNLRKSVETVADALGVSRFTVYNYLDSSRGS
jgi:HTH domain